MTTTTSNTSRLDAPTADAALRIGGRQIDSRLIVGTGKYRDHETMQAALDAGGATVITVAVRRERLIDQKGRSLLDAVDTARYTILPNTAGCFSADDAVRVASLGREILDQLDNPGKDWVKLEVLGDKKTLLPDPVGTLDACRRLVDDGFEVLCYTSDDPVMAQRIKDAGAASVMPAGSPIGSGQGVLNPNNIRLILELLKSDNPAYPVIVRNARPVAVCSASSGDCRRRSCLCGAAYRAIDAGCLRRRPATRRWRPP